jgi:hypothetical protein
MFQNCFFVQARSVPLKKMSDSRWLPPTRAT